MDTINIIITIATSLLGLIGGTAGVLYWRENKALKRAEAAQSNVETQRQEIDLGKKFMEESLSMLQRLQSLQQTNNADTAATVARLDALESKMDNVEVTVDKRMTNITRSLSGYNKRLGSVERYLNGQYKAFQEAEKHKK